VRHRVVENVAVPIQALRIGRIRYNCICRDEAVNIRQKPASIHINQPNILRASADVVVPVAGETNVGQPGRGRGAEAAKGVVAGGAAGYHRTDRRRGQAGGTEMVAVQVVEGVAAVHHLHPQGHRLPGNGIGDTPRGRAVVDLLFVAGEGKVAGLAARMHCLYPDTGRVVGKDGGIVAHDYAGQYMLHVEVLHIGDIAFNPLITCPEIPEGLLLLCYYGKSTGVQPYK
jgi:hypothetical protein